MIPDDSTGIAEIHVEAKLFYWRNFFFKVKCLGAFFDGIGISFHIGYVSKLINGHYFSGRF